MNAILPLLFALDVAGAAPAHDHFLGPRRSELWFEGMLLGHPSDSGFHGEIGAAIDFAPYVPRDAQWLRFSLYHAASLGRWGDGRHGGFTDEPGLALRLSLAPSRALDPFFMLKSGFILSTADGGHFAVRTGSGAGVRYVRLFYLQANVDWIWSLDDRFDSGRVATGGVVFSTGVDACFLVKWCDYK